MSWVLLQKALQMAHISVERVANSLPEGLLIAFLAWLLLRVVGRQNAGTRFAVWITALFAVISLPFWSAFSSILAQKRAFIAPISAHSHAAIPLFWILPISIFWMIGSGLAMARLIAGLWQVRVIRKSSKVVDPALLDSSLQKALQESDRPVIIGESTEVRVPTAIGFFKPMIVFPSWTLRELSPDELRIILIHELAHVRRRDDWTNLLQKLVRAVFFFHPAVWWIDSRLTLEREMACDDAVLAKTGNPRAYASCLVDLLEKNCAQRGWAMAQAAVHRAHEASLRIARILDSRRIGTTRVAKLVPGMAAIFSLGCVGLLLWTPKLVVFQPVGITATVNNTDLSTIPADRLPAPKVVPASFRVSSPVSQVPMAKKPSHHNRRAAVNPATVKANSSPRELKPSVILASAIQKHKQMAPTLLFVQTVEFEMQPGVYAEFQSASLQPRMTQASQTQMEMSRRSETGWQIQVWHVVLMAPAQAQIMGKTI
ncbi:M56 family metallopeptidase [Acidobacterium sp. S8]|uniref:M56 family metallopeptidase n=1 Tax=Acidobacterium sp. S8 TaxID=1641854 RepID=UPI00131B7F77|nr:M56 family metallopeptidase [Acidobacterium sp. S8]